jgi:hypothetical protein
MRSFAGSGRLAARTCTAWVLASVFACGGGGSSDAGSEPPPPVLATDRERADAAVRSALSLVTLTAMLVSEPSRSGAGSTRAVLERSAATADPRHGEALRAVRVACPGGGTLDARCVEHVGGTTVTSVTQDCELLDPDSGLTVTSSGELIARMEALGICQTGMLPPRVPVVYRYRNFRATTSDGDTVLETFDAPRLVQRIEPRIGDCRDDDRLVSYDGGLGLARGDAAFDVVFAQFVLTLRSTGTPCRQTVALAGQAEITDRIGDHSFAVRNGDVEIGLGDGQASMHGNLIIDCIGQVGIATTVQLAGTPCPTAGGLSLQLPGDVAAGASFGPAGELAIDYDADGRADATLPTCRDRSLARCGP